MPFKGGGLRSAFHCPPYWLRSQVTLITLPGVANQKERAVSWASLMVHFLRGVQRSRTTQQSASLPFMALTPQLRKECPGGGKGLHNTQTGDQSVGMSILIPPEHLFSCVPRCTVFRYKPHKWNGRWLGWPENSAILARAHGLLTRRIFVLFSFLWFSSFNHHITFQLRWFKKYFCIFVYQNDKKYQGE